MEFVECGAAALAIVLDYFGRHEPMQRLRVLCDVSRDGATAASIVRAARELGLETRALRCETEHLRGLQPPFIVFWAFNHYLVVEGFGRKKVFVNDPASGRHAVSMSEFDGGFTGIVLTFSKGPGFQKGGQRPSAWRALRRRLEGHASGVGFVALITLALMIPNMVAALLPKVFLDSILDPSAAHWMRPVAAIMALTAVLLYEIAGIQQRALERLENSVAVRSATDFFWRLLRLPMGFFSQRHTGDLADSVAANERLAGLLAGDVATNVVHALLAGVFLALMVAFDKTMAAIVLAVAALNALGLWIVMRKRSDDSQRIAKERSRLFGLSVAGVHSMESLKAMGAESEFFAQWTSRHAELMAAEERMQRSHVVLSTFAPVVSSIGAAAVLGIGALRILDGWLSVGMLVAFQTLMMGFLGPFQRLLSLGARLQQVQGDLRRLDDVLEQPLDPALAGGPRQPPEPRLSGAIELRDVEFGYAAGQPLLKDFNLRIPAGARIALVGASGSGKSTAAKLLAGLYQPWCGEILFDGIPREELPREVLTNSLAMVDQDIAFFSGSIAQNLALLDETVSSEALEAAARDAAIHDDIHSRPGGYAYSLQPMGRNLSGGQRQRLEIARALATDPQILILDEATSALDPLTERAVLDNLKRRGCTCIVVAHRVSAIQECDIVVMMEDGRIVEQGAHQELLSRNGKYAALVA